MSNVNRHLTASEIERLKDAKADLLYYRKHVMRAQKLIRHLKDLCRKRAEKQTANQKTES